MRSFVLVDDEIDEIAEKVVRVQVIALLLTVFVDVVRPGRGLVTGQGWGGNIIRDGASYYVETDDEQVIARCRSYREGAVKLAAHHGHPPAGVRVDVEHEHRTHGALFTGDG